MSIRFLYRWRNKSRPGIARFPFGQAGDPLLILLSPHYEAIAVDSIVGSVDRYASLDRWFRPYGASTLRLRAIQQAMAGGHALPPIEVYRLHGVCYVIDGHHRVAAALAIGQAYLDAQVTECRPQSDTAEDPLEAARVGFQLRTGLRTLAFSEPARYAQALAQIQEHRWYLGEAGRRVSAYEAAEEWYHSIYLPVIRQLIALRLTRLQDPREPGDLYLALSDFKYGMSRERGHDIGFAQAIRLWATTRRRPPVRLTLNRLLKLTMVVP
jgi:hypothetical protein